MPAKKIDLRQICKDNGIILATYKNTQPLIDVFRQNGMSYENIGCAFVFGDRKYILYDDSRPEMEMRFTVAHELAHHLLGHLDYISKGFTEYLLFMEEEANMFAAAIIANDIFPQYAN